MTTQGPGGKEAGAVSGGGNRGEAVCARASWATSRLPSTASRFPASSRRHSPSRPRWVAKGGISSKRLTITTSRCPPVTSCASSAIREALAP